MKRNLVVLTAIITVLTACGKESPPPQNRLENPSIAKVTVERENVGREQPLPPEVKIKLKKDGKESYSWELTGSDVDQVLKVNEKLRKQLGGEKAR